jgi:hypothetical protein
MHYSDFVIRFEQAHGEQLFARVLDSAAGEGGEKIDLLVLDRVRRLLQADPRSLETIGQDLFGALFRGQVLQLFERSSGISSARRKSLRLVLEVRSFRCQINVAIHSAVGTAPAHWNKKVPRVQWRHLNSSFCRGSHSRAEHASSLPFANTRPRK